MAKTSARSPLPAIAAALLVPSLALMLSATADARGFAHAGRNGTGGTVVAGPRGVAASGHTVHQNADGSTTVASGGGFAGVNGARGYRTGSTTVGTDGSLAHAGSAAASGAKGSVQSSGGFSRSAAGTWSGGRSTSATSSQTGNSYSGSTSIDPATGKPVHTGSCSDAAGAPIAC